MRTALAAMAPEAGACPSLHGGRSPCYLLFDPCGVWLETPANPRVLRARRIRRIGKSGSVPGIVADPPL